jgi:2-methylcitrate dehydratase PrpD
MLYIKILWQPILLFRGTRDYGACDISCFEPKLIVAKREIIREWGEIDLANVTLTNTVFGMSLLNSNTKAKVLAKFIKDLRFDGLPQPVVHEAKRALLDFLGAALSGSKTRISEKVVRVITDLNEKQESTIIGYGTRTSAPCATFANTTIGSYLELDDVLGGHPGAIVIPAALSVSEKIGASGKDLLPAIVAGYEVFSRMVKATPAQFHRGIDTCASTGAFGAAAAAGKLLCPHAEQICDALGIAGSLTPMSCYEWLYYGSLVKVLEMAQAAQIGVLSAIFAQNQIDGPPTIMEGDKGFCRVTSAPEQYYIDKITEGLGSTFEILGNYYKPYASCAWTHEPIEAMLTILGRQELVPDDIDSITVRTHKLASELKEKRPKNELQAKFSIPYTLAVAIMDRKVGIDQFTDTKLKDPKLLKLSSKVDIIDDPDISSGAILEVSTKNGKKFIERVEHRKGYTTDEELTEKFLSLASRVMDESKAHQITHVVSKIEEIGDINELINLLRLRSA